ncbi:hypothetical protein O0235_11470 [Tepidiforma flava]|uniref:Uncharacterized protein n=1 Tax=Tepidiforma flava TaxID=3004094 RepID=A0ABY7M4C9_9CHLR|nr:hypothetical protein [Tepidiforma flava]WBL35391.1 hypothetical protein O0235_11470 [Tepidiforma flava]
MIAALRRQSVRCDGRALAIEPVTDAAGRPRLRLAVVLNPHAGGYLRVIAAELTPRQAHQLIAAVENLLLEEGLPDE